MHTFVCMCIYMYVMHVEMNTLNTRVQKQKENSSFLELTFIKEGIKVVLTNVAVYREKEKGRQQ